MKFSPLILGLLVAVRTSIAKVPYKPERPASYKGCAIDPNARTPFELLDAHSAIPIVDKNGKASKATKVIKNLDPFYFSKPPNAPRAIYDITLKQGSQTLYLAVYKDGHVGFSTCSSNGQKFITRNGQEFVTTVFSVACNGGITAGILGGAQYNFDILKGHVVVKGLKASKVEGRDIPIPTGFYVLPETSAAPPPVSTDRCPNNGQAVPKTPPVPPTANGCGTATGIGSFVPELDFHECCNGHDYCYGDCSTTFDGCNTQFLQCNINQCDQDFPGGGLLHWACNKAAHVYGNAVTGSIGAKAFTDATAEYCDCGCADETLTMCNGKCVDLTTDPDNCGSCDFHCPTGKCSNGACAFDSCQGQTCDTFGPCGPGGSCVCASIVDHTGFCVDGSTPCAGLQSCGTSLDCPLGSVCAVGSCCGGNVCITTDQCGGFDTNGAMLHHSLFDGPTFASRGGSSL